MRYLEIFWVFLKLGCTSFGGPIAHLVYFRKAFVEEKAWLSEAEYANILTLCQSLPGPASSQVGFTIGLRRAGLFGALAAFIAFTLPSIVLLLLFAHSLFMFESQFGKASLEGLMILAFAVVLHGVLGMGKKLCAANTHFFIALCTFIIVLLSLVGGSYCRAGGNFSRRFLSGLWGYTSFTGANVLVCCIFRFHARKRGWNSGRASREYIHIFARLFISIRSSSHLAPIKPKPDLSGLY